MKIRNQKDAFLKYEADNYFARNKNVEYKGETDVVIKMLQEYNVQPNRALEIGCNTGYRLDALFTLLQCLDVTGIEPSKQAIDLGRKMYPQVHFIHGTADDMSSLQAASFDLIIIGFVLYVVDRDILFKVVEETDRVLKDGGLLIIVDFFSEKPTRNPYQHIQEIEAFAYKQNYDEMFTASKLYHVIDKRSMDHASKDYDASNDFYNKYAMTTLKKDLAAGYR
ncbi:MAG TPA: class I SAM-dependent methyltransferase [Chryseolinea sp.]